MLLVHLFVCFVRVSFCHLSLPLGVVVWLRFAIVALPGLLNKLFRFSLYLAVKSVHITEELK